ncbi:MAG: Coenzyme F420:L-glutamate ligase [bacterium ADurb.Bin431]|nr:MAG: Coenzyme F420:L-glutamate ligase [bacterium ADurb.Bin431]HNY92228.1 nitroreductase family protein [bacterium]HOH06722.1 nitroreductase family protein [bacterium]
MELVKAIEQRRTVRRFSSAPVAAESLKELARRAGLAPSINNSQPWKFIAVTRAEVIREMAAAVHQRVSQLFAGAEKENILRTVDHFSTVFEHAPAVLFVAARPYQAIADEIGSGETGHDALNAMRRHPDLQSVGAAVQNILLSATELGLGACWLSGLMVARPELEKVLGLEQPWELVTAIAIGTPESTPVPKQHPPVEQIFTLID